MRDQQYQPIGGTRTTRGSDMNDDEARRSLTELVITDLLNAAEDVFKVRPNMRKITIERMDDGTARIKVKRSDAKQLGGHWVTTKPPLP